MQNKLKRIFEKCVRKKNHDIIDSCVYLTIPILGKRTKNQKLSWPVMSPRVPPSRPFSFSLPSPLSSHHYFEFVFLNSPVFHDSFATYIYIPNIYMYTCA